MYVHKYFPLLYLLLLAAGLQAQFTNRAYDSGGNERGLSLEVIDNKLIVIGGSTDANVTDRTTALYHMVSLRGELVRTQRYETPGRSSIRAMALGANLRGEFVTAGWTNTEGSTDDVLLHRIDTTSRVLAAARIGQAATDEQVRGLKRLRSGSYVVVGNNGSTGEAYVALVTQNLETVWERSFEIEGRGFTILTGAFEQADGELLLTGTTTAGSFPRDLVVLRVNLIGELLSQAYYELPADADAGFNAASFELRNGGAVVTTQFGSDALVVTLGRDGKVASSFALRNPTGRFGIVDGIETSSGDYLLLANEYPEGQDEPIRAVLLQVDLSERAVEGKTFLSNFDGFGPSRGAAIARYPLGGYVIAGTVEPCRSAPGETDMFLAYASEVTLINPSCGPSIVPAEWLPGPTFAATQPGRLTEYISEEQPAAALTTGSATTQALSCRLLDLDENDSTTSTGSIDYNAGTFCYTDPFPIADDLFLSVRPPSRIVVTAPAPERLLIGEFTAPGLTRDGPGRLTLSSTDVATYRRFLERIRVEAQPETVAEMRRRVEITVADDCTEYSYLVRAEYVLLRSSRLRSNIPDTVLCPGGELVLDATNRRVTAYDWGDGAQDARFRVTEPGTYTVRLTNACGAVGFDTVVVRPGVTFAAPEPRRIDLCAGDSAVVDLSDEFVDSYGWSDGVVGPVRQFSTRGVFTATLMNGCGSQTTSVDVSVTDCCRLYLPTAFSPNFDGVNDTFRPAFALEGCGAVTDYSLRVYDRWGGEVFRGADPEVGWDGSRVGEVLGPGVYTFSLRYFNGLFPVTRSGSVLLTR